MNDNVHSLLGPYLVNAVSPAERDDFESHLATCEDCRDEVASLRDVTTTLAEAEAVSPPASLRARVMAEASRTAQLPPLADTTDANDVAATDNTATAITADAAAAQSSSTPEPVPASASVTHISDAKRSRPARRRNAFIGVAAASVLILGAAGIGLSTQNSRDEHAQELAVEKELMMVTTAPDAYSMDLDLGASHLVMSAKMDGVVAMGHDAPMPDKGMEYQLWLMMDDGKSMPGPTFMPEGDGEFVTMMHSSFDDVEMIYVTQEPMGGSDAPTSAPLTEVHL
ncbi:anti-sigma factor [Demequina oxidasica]|uniref:anti-sigma factor n=1 Tax=Demequina oxidasica TaxID=676199 RepID=UPI000783E362|nr:anti-sigma factor [Demequina oxidasica]